MPRIATYDAPATRLSPEERGADAATRAGRYVGQYRRQEAEDIRAGGVLQAQGIRERGWPFDIIALEEGRGSGGSGGGGRGSSGGGGVQSNGGSHSLLNDHGQASRGAGALGSIMQRFNGTSTSPHGKVAAREQVNEDGSRYKWFSDGSRQIERADGTVIKTDRNGHTSGGGGGGGGRQQLPYTLDSSGHFVRADRDPLSTANARAAGVADATARYWQRYNGGNDNGLDTSDVDEFGVPRVRTDEYGNPFAPGPRDALGYQPPPPIPGEGAWPPAGPSGDFSSRDPAVEEVARFSGQTDTYASDPSDDAAIAERE